MDQSQTPHDPADLLRWTATRKKRRILYGRHEQDVTNLTRKVVGSMRTEAWKAVDLSSNVALESYTAQAVLFDSAPTLNGDPELEQLIVNSGLWDSMRRTQRDTLGLRVVFVRPNVVRGRLTYRVVWPDMVTVKTDGDDTSRPVVLRELREFTHPLTGRSEWLWEEFDISDPDNPSWRILDIRSPSNVEDRSADYLDGGALTGPAYPAQFRGEGGEPFIPHAAYRAERSPDFWDSNQSAAVFEGTLWTCVQYSYFSHVFRNAAWAQRYAIDVEPLGAGHLDENSDGRGREAVVTDPSTVMRFKSMEDGQAQLGQWSVAADPVTALTAVQGYERAVLGRSGLNPADISRVSGDPRSGYSLALTRDGERDAQKRHAPMGRSFVQELVAKSAYIAGANLGTTFDPATSVVFSAIEASTSEQTAESAYLDSEVVAGRMSRAQVLQRKRPGLSTEQAIAELSRVAIEEQALTALIEESATGGADKASDTALNGAQVTAAKAIVVDVGAGLITSAAGRAMLVEFFNLSPEAAARMIP